MVTGLSNKQAAIRIIHDLNRAGFQALLAGGCVRDTLLGKIPKDYDIATDAKPQDICRIFRRTIKVGAKFGVIIVLTDGHQIEVATFRAEEGYSDGRRPDKVRFTSDKEDALRRDFTINGMFYDLLKKEVIDYVGGQKDLKRKIIRTIGNAEERFSEDFLRMLRAVRFAAQLDFKVDKDTLNAVKKLCGRITKISGERIAMELESLLASPNRVKGVRLFVETGLAENVFPIFKNQNVFDFTLNIFKRLPKEITFELGLAALFAFFQTAEAMNNLEILKLSNNQLKYIKFLLEKRDFLLSGLSLAQLKLIISEPYFEDLFLLQKVIQKVKRESISPLSAIRKRAKTLIGRELRPKPLLNGFELIRLGARPGPQVGIIGKELYIEQLSERVNTKLQARTWVENWLKKHKLNL